MQPRECADSDRGMRRPCRNRTNGTDRHVAVLREQSVSKYLTGFALIGSHSQSCVAFKVLD